MTTVVPIDIRDELLHSPSFADNCNKADDGKYYFIDQSTMKLADTEKIYTFQPVRKDAKILKSRDGIYVYIIASTEEERARNKVHIYAIRTLTVHEAKTKHTNLIKRIRKILSSRNKQELRYLYYAGEFVKKGDSIRFNFMSGTYMRDRNIVSLILNETDVANNQAHIDFVKELFRKYGMPNADIDLSSTLINPNNLRLTKADIDQLVSYGIKVYEYDNVKDCKQRKDYDFHLAKAQAQFDVQMRIYEKYGKETGNPPPIFQKPNVVEGREVSRKGTTKMLGKRKRSTQSSSRTSNSHRKSMKRQRK